MPHLLPGDSLGFLINDVSRLFRQAFERAVIEAGMELTPGEIRALAYVARYPGSRQAKLADNMGVEPMTLSAYLDRLENRKLIARATDPTDRRAKIVTLTEISGKIFEDARPIAEQVFDHMVEGLEPEAVSTVQTALRQMRANLASDPAPPVTGGATAATLSASLLRPR